MIKLFTLSVALGAAMLFFESSTQAQMYQQGYEFGTGWQAARFGHGHGHGNFLRDFNNFRDFRPTPSETTFERPPYFAQFPPVYYSHVVPRPYGISPYAAPPGIAPVEMSIPVILPNPTKIYNPHFDRNEESEEPVPSVVPTKQTNAQGSNRTSTKTNRTWITNPYYVESAGIVARNN